MDPNYWTEVIEDFEDALENKDHYDVIIKVGEDTDEKELKAHSFVLRARCSYFKRALSNDWKEKDDDGNFIFKKPNISFEVFQLIIRQVNNIYIYFLTMIFALVNIILSFIITFKKKFLDICIREL